jgi:hypothetical protein
MVQTNFLSLVAESWRARGRSCSRNTVRQRAALTSPSTRVRVLNLHLRAREPSGTAKVCFRVEVRGQSRELAMSRSKQLSKIKSPRIAATALGVAGALSLAGGASASVAPTQNTARIILAEEEVSDVSLATFYVFDKENAGAHQSGLQVAARGCGHGGCRGCAAHAGCRGCAHAGCRGCAVHRGCRGCAGGGCGGCGGGCCIWLGPVRVC